MSKKEKFKGWLAIALTLFMASQIMTRELWSLKISAGFITLYAFLHTWTYFLSFRNKENEMEK